MRFRRSTLVDFPDVLTHGGSCLPHWQLDGGYYFITIRLADSLPADTIERLRRDRSRLLRTIAKNPDEPTDAERDKVERFFGRRLDEFLDLGRGACWLREDRVAALVAGAFQFFNNERYRLFAWCVMPNHAHVLMQLFRGADLERVLHSWKSYTSSEANKVLGRSGVFWQRDYFDRLVRDEDGLEETKRYIVQNPSSAGLLDWRWKWACE
jgi:REP element-mobilizing transposase RayT